jgi:hypothetical protein
MKGFILGFQRFVWCPKWTPESNNSFTPMLITIFPLVEPRELICFRAASRGTRDFYLMLLWFALAPSGVTGRIHSMRIEPFSPQPFMAKGMTKIAEKREVATGIFGRAERILTLFTIAAASPPV